MSRSLSVEAIILHSHDVGEADRFCILFTKERGKLAARARGVRKPKSRFGGSILPLQHVELTLNESSAGHLITDARVLTTPTNRSIHSTSYAQQGVEILVRVLHDDEPIPELFTATLMFLQACDSGISHPVLPFTLQLLSILGYLPEAEATHLQPVQQEFMKRSASGEWGQLPALNDSDRQTFSTLCAALLSEMCTTPLKAGQAISSM